MSISPKRHHFAFLCILLVSANHVTAAEFTARWIGQDSENWSNPANWQITPPAPAGTIPNNTATDVFDVICEFAGYINLDLAVTIRNLTLTAPAAPAHSVVILQGDSDLMVDGNLTWRSARMEGGGTTIVQGDATLQNESFLSPEQGGLKSRSLVLKGATTLSTDFIMEHGARMVNEQDATFNVLSGGSFTVRDENPSPEFVNRGHFSSSPGISLVLPHFRNENRVDIPQNSHFEFGDGFVQEAGKLRLDGGTTQYTFGGMVINSGELSGFGTNSGIVQVNGTLSPSPQTLSFSDDLYLGANARSTFALGGPNGGREYDNAYVAHLYLGGQLEIHFANGFESTVQETDDFLIVRAGNIIDTFANVRFGERLFTSDDLGSFVVQQDARGIHLSNFQKASTSLNFSTAPGYYTFSPNELLLDPQATVISPAPKWPDGQLTVEFLSGFDPTKDLLGIHSVGDGGDQISIDPWLLGTSVVRFGGVEFGALQLDSATGRLDCVFEPNATTKAVQALVRSLFFTTRDFTFDSFVNGPIHPSNRRLRLTLSDGADFHTTLEKTIRFPDLESVSWNLSFIGLDFGAETDLTLGATFIYDDNTEASVKPFAITPFRFTDDCTSATITVTAPGQLHIAANPNLQSDTCIITFHAGPKTADVQLHVGTDCTGLYVALVAYFLNISNPKPLTALKIPSPSTNSALISVPLFRTFEHLLNDTAEGRRLAALYWQHTAEVVSILKTNSTLAAAAARVFLDFQPAVSALLTGNGASARITQPMIDQLNSVWDKLVAVGSSGLKADLNRERDRFHNFQDFVAKDFSQWAGLLQVEAPAQPLIFVSRATLLDGQFRIEANSLPGMTFSVWRFSIPGNWELVPDTQVQDDGYTVTLRDPHPNPSRSLYQVRAIATGGR